MAHSPTCVVKKCPEKSVVRIEDKVHDKRRDFCQLHGYITIEHYRNWDHIVVVDAFNGLTVEQFMKDYEEYQKALTGIRKKLVGDD